MNGFQNVNYLIGLAILPLFVLLLLYVLGWKKKIRRQLGTVSLINQLCNNYSPKKYIIKVVFTFIAFALLVIAAANWQSIKTNKVHRQLGVDVMFALDVSRSMLSRDNRTTTRLDEAKNCMRDLMKRMPYNSMGLVLFAGTAYLQSPITPDPVALNMFIDNASPELIGLQGTVIGSALRLCNQSLDIQQRKYKAIVLITDGEDHDGSAVQEARMLYATGTVVFTVGIGSLSGAPIIIDTNLNRQQRDKDGVVVISKLNVSLLKDIASASNGNYFFMTKPATTAAAVTAALNTMDKKSVIIAGGDVVYQPYFLFFAFAALIFLLVESFITEKKKEID